MVLKEIYRYEVCVCVCVCMFGMCVCVHANFISPMDAAVGQSVWASPPGRWSYILAITFQNLNRKENYRWRWELHVLKKKNQWAEFFLPCDRCLLIFTIPLKNALVKNGSHWCKASCRTTPSCHTVVGPALQLQSNRNSGGAWLGMSKKHKLQISLCLLNVFVFADADLLLAKTL